MPERHRALAVAALAAIGVAAACSSLPTDASGVVELRVTLPDSLALGTGDSITLHATAFDIQGDSIAAVVRWRTPDTALVSLDSLSGLVVARTDSGAARVQASAGNLLSNTVTIPLRPDTTAGTGGAGVRTLP